MRDGLNGFNVLTAKGLCMRVCKSVWSGAGYRKDSASLLNESVYRGAPSPKEERGGRSAVNT